MGSRPLEPAGLGDAPGPQGCPGPEAPACGHWAWPWAGPPAPLGAQFHIHPVIAHALCGLTGSFQHLEQGQDES